MALTAHFLSALSILMGARGKLNHLEALLATKGNQIMPLIYQLVAYLGWLAASVH